VITGANHVASASKGKQEEASAHGEGKESCEAAKEARIDLDELHQHRYEIFDALVQRHVRVAWVTVPTYHLLVYDAGKAQATWESVAVEWHSPAEIASAPGRSFGRARIGGAARAILEWPNFDALVEKAGRSKVALE
jgi:hypothetical protein